jgi:hypothetical protein
MAASSLCPALHFILFSKKKDGEDDCKLQKGVILYIANHKKL